jgi:hypothetical protein
MDIISGRLARNLFNLIEDSSCRPMPETSARCWSSVLQIVPIAAN